MPASRRSVLVRAVGVAGVALATSLVAAAVTAGFAAPQALAATPHATVTGDGGEEMVDVGYDGGAGNNDLRISTTPAPDSFNYLLLRDNVQLDLGEGTRACSYPNAADHRTVRCVVTFNTDTEPLLTAHLGAGNDTASIAPHNGIVTNVDGGSGNDHFVAGNYFDDVHGGSGNDTISVTALGVHAVYGDDGNDKITGSDHKDLIFGGPGNDSIRGGKGADTIYGNSGNDTIYGNSGNDTISGGPGRDKISGGPGSDKIKS